MDYDKAAIEALRKKVEELQTENALLLKFNNRQIDNIIDWLNAKVRDNFTDNDVYESDIKEVITELNKLRNYNHLITKLNKLRNYNLITNI
jgi:hypothetical protein